MVLHLESHVGHRALSPLLLNSWRDATAGGIICLPAAERLCCEAASAEPSPRLEVPRSRWVKANGWLCSSAQEAASGGRGRGWGLDPQHPLRPLWRAVHPAVRPRRCCLGGRSGAPQGREALSHPGGHQTTPQGTPPRDWASSRMGPGPWRSWFPFSRGETEARRGWPMWAEAAPQAWLWGPGPLSDLFCGEGAAASLPREVP